MFIARTRRSEGLPTQQLGAKQNVAIKGKKQPKTAFFHGRAKVVQMDF
jgi:hypothetical protein